MQPRIGSLFSGYGGLTEAVEAVTGGRTVWVSDIDPGACKILAHNYPDTPNLGDITKIDWDDAEDIEILDGGFPCQDLSLAGARAGMRDGTRSGLWAIMCQAIANKRPQLVVIENVRGLLSAAADSDVQPCPWCMGNDPSEPPMRALGAVLADLANLGYDAAWYGLRAADVGAPHGRFRVFIIAWPVGDSEGVIGERGGPVRIERTGNAGAGRGADRPATQDTDGATGGERWVAASGQTAGGGAWADAGGRDRVLADPDGAGLQGPRPAPGRHLSDGCVDADPSGVGWLQTGPEPAGVVGGSDAAVGGDEFAADPIGSGLIGRARNAVGGSVGGVTPTGSGQDDDPYVYIDGYGWDRVESFTGRELSVTNWGEFEPAIRRWEQLTRPAPAPTETGPKGGQRLSPRFVEWMMGLPDGWVTGVPGLTRNEQLKALGNGVVPAQAEAALRHLLGVAGSAR